MRRPIDSVLESLDGAKRAGKGFKARCPAHADKTPSLSILEGADGRVLLHCFAGCTVESVVAAAGLQMTDLFLKNAETRSKLRVSGVSVRELHEAVALETQILYFLKADQHSGKNISNSDWERAKLALRRISLAKRVL